LGVPSTCFTAGKSSTPQKTNFVAGISIPSLRINPIYLLHRFVASRRSTVENARLAMASRTASSVFSMGVSFETKSTKICFKVLYSANFSDQQKGFDWLAIHKKSNRLPVHNLGHMTDRRRHLFSFEPPTAEF
jgi:hypothetical protein